MICQRCSKDVAGIHTCTPTGLVRDLEQRIKELEAERNAYRNTAISLREYADKLMQRGDNFKEQLAASQAREQVLRDALITVQRVICLSADDAPSSKIGRLYDYVGRTLSTPSDDTALREYGAKLLEEMAEEWRKSWLAGQQCAACGRSRLSDGLCLMNERRKEC